MPVSGVKTVKRSLSSRASSQRTEAASKAHKKKVSKNPSSRLLKNRCSSSATASSLESDGIVGATTECGKDTYINKVTKPVHASEHSKKKLSAKSKKSKSKSKKSKEINQTVLGDQQLCLDGPPADEKRTANIETVAKTLNETLRWNNICSDSEDETERINLYKENRRKRFAEAMQVKVMQKMTGPS